MNGCSTVIASEQHLEYQTTSFRKREVSETQLTFHPCFPKELQNPLPPRSILKYNQHSQSARTISNN